ncbi:hypothetical protein B0H13DRAFT_1883531 [Mycena leptocephala]|nr:hypothetical protein B0H13DRAFT_1883531 [Mycena leptocephala]
MTAGQPFTVDPDKSFYSTCSLWKLETDEFFNIKLGKCPKTCRVCNQRKTEKNKDKPRDSTATGQSYPTDGGDADEDLSDLPRVTLEEFLAIIAIWVKSVLRRGVGEDVVKDVRRYKSSNRNRDTTWATAGDPEERR